jgi:CAAX protease family protein
VSFTLRFSIVLAAGIIAAVILAPFAGWLVAAAGFRIPFPRIFDRTVMVTVFGAILISARELELHDLLVEGFADPFRGLRRSGRGFAVAIGALALIFATAYTLGGRLPSSLTPAAERLPGFMASAVAIAIIEEGFFRAFLLGGMEEEFGSTSALAGSSAIYAVAHLVRAPARFYVTELEPLAGLRTLGASVAQLAHPIAALPSLFGLLLLGILLGAAFVVTRTVYFSMGLHAGLVIGAKLWPRLVVGRAAVPLWLAGYGELPLISGAAAWIVACALLTVLRPLSGVDRRGAV